jgi:two-component system, response regulator PdtaR
VNPNPNEADLRGLDVLIAEDEFLTALDIAQAVEALGGEVLGPVAEVSDGLALVNRSQPDVALLDVQLRDGFVTPLATALDRMDVPFALVTGYQGQELELMPLKNAPRLSKPYRRSDLARTAELLRKAVLRGRAHAIWEREGRPEGQADRHWSMAERELREAVDSTSPADASRLRPQGDHGADRGTI